MTTDFATADLYDKNEHNTALQVVSPIFRHFGGVRRFFGTIRTLRVMDDNSWVRHILKEKGDGQVLVIDGGGIMRSALLGDLIAKSAVDNHWRGIIIHGYIRDSVAIGQMPIGVMALGTNPRKTVKREVGERDVALTFADCRWTTGDYLYADEDGVLVSPSPLGEGYRAD